MTTDLAQIAGIFSCLHDGRITRATVAGERLRLDVQIQYLAARIEPNYLSFALQLDEVTDLQFLTWPNDAGRSASLITAPPAIFAPCLQILEGTAVDGTLLVTCNQHSPAYDYCGGELRARAGSARIIDEGGRAVSFDELEALSKAYWDDWSTRT